MWNAFIVAFWTWKDNGRNAISHFLSLFSMKNFFIYVGLKIQIHIYRNLCYNEEKKGASLMADNTIFDDVFRTMLEKMPVLIIPVINEVFHTSYTKKDEIVQYRNEHHLPSGGITTDSFSH